MKKKSLNAIVKIAVLSALAFVLMELKFSIPIFPSFLEFEFSEIPVIIAAFAIGPFAGVAVEFFKNVIHIFVTSTMGVGEFANFVIGSSFALAAGLYYKHHKSKKGAVVSVVIGTLSAVLFSCIVNYFIMLPFYSAAMGLSTEMIVGMSQKAMPLIVDKPTLILYGFLPFNILKNVVMSIVIMLIYKPISPLLHRTYIQ